MVEQSALTKPIIWLTDRSRIAAYRDCPRLRYLTYHFAGKGLQRTTLGLPLVNGDFVHLALARLLVGEDLDVVLAELSTKYRAAVLERGLAGEANVHGLIAEQLCLLEGLVRAWAQVRLPLILAEYLVVDVEREFEFTIAPGIVIMIRLDAVLRRKSDGLLFIKDYKTTTAIYDADWGKKFEHDSQMLCYILAAESIFNEPIGGMLMEGLLKGKRAVDKGKTSAYYGQTIQQSPLCYAYRQRERVTGQYVYDHSWSKAAEKAPIWEMPGGVRAWLADWSPLDLADLFVVAPAIRPARRDLERYRRQVIYQEQQLQFTVMSAEALRAKAASDQGTAADWTAYEENLDHHFPQNHNQCFRYFGYPCAMERLCFTEGIEDDPIGSGFYQTRIPHHATEDEAA